jgi:hypothetical protein
MGFLCYEPDELPATLARVVRWRWPGEHLLLTAPCRAEWPVPATAWGEEAPRDRYEEPGALGVTESRLVYRNRDRPSPPFRVASLTFAAVAAVGFLAGEGSGLVPVAAALALILWVVATLVEVLGAGIGSIERGRVTRVDRVLDTIEGADRWGIAYRLRLDGPDLDRVAALLAG